MRKFGLLILIFSLTIFLSSSFADNSKADKTVIQPVVKADKEEPFLWDLIFSNTKSEVPMVSTSTEIAISPYDNFVPKTEVFSSQKVYGPGDRLLVQNHVWNEGDLPGNVDYYLAFWDHLRPDIVYFWNGIIWKAAVGHQFLRMSVGFDRTDTLIDMRLPQFPPVGKFAFASALAEPGTFTVYSFSTIMIQITN